jgi:formylglycine-generating enzyme required for sulfatase activity
MEFVEIPAGRFMMGAPHGKADASAHPVHITRPFFLETTELTAWEESEIGIATGKWPRNAHVPRRRDTERPTTISNWNEAQKLAEMLSKVDPDYRYRLPTEAEWEYACRGATAGVGSDDGDLPKGETYRPYRKEYLPGDRLRLDQPNAFGVHNMLSNVGEYCADWYSADYYQSSRVEAPTGPSEIASPALDVLSPSLV